jgi:hypothetical protein
MVLMLFLITLMSPDPLPSLRCMRPGTPIEELHKSSAVFTGKVSGRDYIEDDASENGVAGQRLVVRLKVERVWKGDIGGEVKMYTSEVRHPNGLTSMMSEDFHFQDGKRYLVYAGGQVERLSTSACTRSRELEKAGDDLRELGEGHEPKRKRVKSVDTVGEAEQAVAADAP